MERGRSERQDAEGLDSRLETMKREIDALQIQVMKGGAPWYTQVPVIIPMLVSVLALGFAFYTNHESESRVSREEQHAQRAELRSLIQRLSALPKENFQLRQKNPSEWRQLSGPIQRETLILARQSSELIHELAGRVTSEEYVAVAFALSSAGQTVESEELTEEGLKAGSKDAAGEATLLRQLGNLRYANGDPKGARETFAQAMEVYERYPMENRSAVANNSTFTQIDWSETALSHRQCPEAWQHIMAAKRFDSTNAWRRVIENAERNIVRTCGTDTTVRR